MAVESRAQLQQQQQQQQIQEMIQERARQVRTRRVVARAEMALRPAELNSSSLAKCAHLKPTLLPISSPLPLAT